MRERVPELLEAEDRLSSEANRLRVRLEALEADLRSVRQAMAIVARIQGAGPGVVPVSRYDIQHCTSQREVLYAIAMRNGGVVNATEAGKLILEAGMKKKGTANPSSSLFSIMKKSDEWEKVSPGTFRLLSFEADQVDGESDCDVEMTEWQGESSQNDSGNSLEVEFLGNEVIPGEPASRIGML